MESFDKICPNDVLVDLFFRLDVEYLMRLKCVSKLWCRPVSDSCVPTISKRLSPCGIHFRNAAMSLMVHDEVSSTYVPMHWLSGKNVRARFYQEELEETCLDRQFMGYVSIGSSTEETQQLEMNFYHYYSNLFAHLLQFEYSYQAQDFVEDSRNSIPKAQAFLLKKKRVVDAAALPAVSPHYMVVCLSLRNEVDNTVFGGGFRLGFDIFSSESRMWEQHWIHLDIPVKYFTLKRNPVFLDGVLNMTGKESCVEKMDDTDSFGEICPDDVLVDIFFRLEVKDLMRLKCVSKLWYRLISDSCVPMVSKRLSPLGVHFRTAAMSYEVYDEVSSKYVWMHSLRRKSIRDRFHRELETCFDRQFMGYACLSSRGLAQPRESTEIDFDRDKNNLLYGHLLPFERCNEAQDFVDSRNGLLLFSKESSASSGWLQYYVCNPTTNQCISLPPKAEKAATVDVVHAALAFDPGVSPHYKVVCLSLRRREVEDEEDTGLAPHQQQKPVGLLGVDIFSSESVMWEHHQVEELDIPIEYFAALKRNSVLLDGVLYMLSLSWKVIRFDINSLEFSVIDLPIPDIIWGKKGYKGCFGLIDGHYTGCLGLAAGRVYYTWVEGIKLRLWSLDQGGGFFWTLIHTADIGYLSSRIFIMDGGNMEHYTIWALPCGVHPNAEAIFIGTPRCIFLYHFKTNELQMLHQASEGQLLPLCFYSVFVYCRCLVPLNQFSSSTGRGQGKKHFSLTGFDIFSSESRMWEQYRIHLDIPVKYFTLKRNPVFLDGVLNMTGKESCVEKMDDTDSFGEICPDDVLVDIFFRLEVKDLMRLKCVSKPWYRLISDSCVPTVSKRLSPLGVHFRTAATSYEVYDEVSSKYVWMHSLRRKSIRDRFHGELETCFDRQFMGYACLSSRGLAQPRESTEIDVDRDKNNLLYGHLLPFERCNEAQDFVDSRNGLLLFSKESSASSGWLQYYVCNPTTNQCISLPPKAEEAATVDVVHAALAFDPGVSLHYKVVCLSLRRREVEDEEDTGLAPHQQQKPVGLLGVDIFSSESVMWEHHQVEELDIPIEYFAALKRNSVLLDGVLYMLSLSWKVIRFDINSLEFCVIDLPIPDIINGKVGYKGCYGLIDGHYRGCLGLAAGRVYYTWVEGIKLRLWSLDQGGGGFFWTLIHTANIGDLSSRIFVMDGGNMEHYTIWALPCGVHPNAEAIFIGTPRCIFLYHFKTNELQMLHQASEGQLLPLCFYSVFVYCRCLVPLNQFSSTERGQGKKHFSLTGN